MYLLGSSELALAFLIACSAKVTVIFILAWLIVTALRGQSAALRHHAWAAGILSSLALPAFMLLLPSWHSAALGGAAVLWRPANTIGTEANSDNLPAMIVSATEASPLFGKLAAIVLLVWVVGFLVLALRLAVGLLRLAWASVHATPLHQNEWLSFVAELSGSLRIARPVRVLQSANLLAMPLTWGTLRPVVILPAGASEWPENRRRIVLFHEFAHIARHDWFLQICAELARSFYWFHPLAWMAAKSLRHESEHACDDSVLNSGIEASQYANHLLDLVRTLENSHRSWSVALAIARPSTLERRFLAMLNPSVNRDQLSRRAGAFTMLLALCLLLPLATLQLSAQNLAGKFTGTIYDPSGAAVPNSTVIMTNHKSNATEMTTSDAKGNFKFTALSAGEYEMKVLKQGFQEYKMPQVVLEPGRESSHSLTLKVGSITEEVNVVAEGTVRALPAPSGGKPSRIRLGGDIQAAKLLNKVQPVYPEAAKAAGIQGTVILHAVIGMDGKPLSLHVMNSQADPELARAAVESVSQWRYSPTLLNGEPIEVDTTITVNFSLLP